MKKIVLAAVAAMSLGIGAASAAPAQNHGNGFERLPSPAYTYSPGNG
jgi:hypothetical protein